MEILNLLKQDARIFGIQKAKKGFSFFARTLSYGILKYRIFNEDNKFYIELNPLGFCFENSSIEEAISFCFE